MVPWTRRMQFWQTNIKNFERGPKKRCGMGILLWKSFAEIVSPDTWNAVEKTQSKLLSLFLISFAKYELLFERKTRLASTYRFPNWLLQCSGYSQEKTIEQKTVWIKTPLPLDILTRFFFCISNCFFYHGMSFFSRKSFIFGFFLFFARNFCSCDFLRFFGYFSLIFNFYPETLETQKII